MGKRDKTPKTKGGFIPEKDKTPRSVILTSNNDKPSWRFAMLQVADPFGWHVLEKEKLFEVHSKLCEFEVLTWNEILIERRKQNHTVYKNQLCKEAQKQLEQIGQEDVDELVSLHLSGTERVWGIRDRAILRLLWWDPDHQVYPYQKKHT